MMFNFRRTILSFTLQEQMGRSKAEILVRSALKGHYCALVGGSTCFMSMMKKD